MIRLPILLVFAVSLLTGSCGEGIGEDIAEGIVKGLYAELYREFSEEGDLLDDDKLTANEVRCSDPLFTRTEPLPAGTHPETFTTPGNSYWECPESNERYHADGRLSGNFTSNYQEILDFWNICEVGTRPPNVEGNWVVTEDAFFCGRFDLLPGIVICTDTETGENGIVIQYGEVIDSFYDDDEETCVFREE